MSQALYFPTTVLMGSGSIELIPNEISKIDAKKALVVTDEILVKLGVAQKVLDVLDGVGIEYAVFSDVKPNPTVKNVTDGLQCLKDNDCDFVISIGGGSPQDAAKGVAILATNPGDLVAYEGINKTENKSLPIVAVNTMAGTASEATINYVITDEERKVKMVIVDTNSIATIAVNDADLMVDMPADLTAATGMDALTHAIEGFITKGASPFTNMFNLEAIKSVSKFLERAVKDGSDIEAREGMAYGQFITGMGFSNCGLGIVHSMAHQLGGFYDLPHGVCNAILLPYVMEYNAEETGDKYRTIAETMGVDTEGMDLEAARAACIEAVKNLSEAVGIPADFTTLGVKKEDIDQLAGLAMIDVCTPGNPRDPEKEDMVELYKKVF